MAAGPCHGLKDNPSSIDPTAAALHESWAPTCNRATSTYGLSSSGHTTDASPIGILSRSVQSWT